MASICLRLLLIFISINIVSFGSKAPLILLALAVPITQLSSSPSNGIGPVNTSASTSLQPSLLGLSVENAEPVCTYADAWQPLRQRIDFSDCSAALSSFKSKARSSGIWDAPEILLFAGNVGPGPYRRGLPRLPLPTRTAHGNNFPPTLAPTSFLEPIFFEASLVSMTLEHPKLFRRCVDKHCVILEDVVTLLAPFPAKIDDW